MLRSSKVALLALTLTACGEDADSGPCAQRKGTYRATYTQRAGNCGSFEQVDTIDEQPTEPSPPCTGGEIRYSEDNCEVTNIDITCPGDNGAIAVQNGKYNWSKDGSSGHGSGSILITDDVGFLCQSTYDVTLERL